MAYAGYVWECECGHTELGENPPKECEKRYRVNSFTQLPEEIVDEKENNNLENLQ